MRHGVASCRGHIRVVTVLLRVLSPSPSPQWAVVKSFKLKSATKSPASAVRVSHFLRGSVTLDRLGHDKGPGRPLQSRCTPGGGQ
jgi:hypothetical protein